jgi:hypothetical protein
VLSAAAVLGVEFDESALGAMVQIDADTLGDVLDRATAAGVIAPGTRVTARHGSPMRSLRAASSPSWGAALGRGCIRRHSTSCRTPSGSASRRRKLTHHAELAGRRADAQRWAGVAGDEALAGLAAQEAMGWYRRALDHARALDRPPADLADLTVCLGDAATRAGDPAALDILQEGAALARAHGNDDALRHAALAMNPGSLVRFGAAAPQQLAIAEAALASVTDDDLATRARLEALVAHSLVHTDQTQRRAGAAAAALETARATGDPTVLRASRRRW